MKRVQSLFLMSLCFLALFFGCSEEVLEPELPNEVIGHDAIDTGKSININPVPGVYNFITFLSNQTSVNLDEVNLNQDHIAWLDVAWSNTIVTGHLTTGRVSDRYRLRGVDQTRYFEIPYANLPEHNLTPKVDRLYFFSLMFFETEDLVANGDIVHELVLFYVENGVRYYFPETRKQNIITMADLHYGNPDYPETYPDGYAFSRLKISSDPYYDDYNPFTESPNRGYYVMNRIYPANNPPLGEVWELSNGLNIIYPDPVDPSNPVNPPCSSGPCPTGGPEY